jgi:hypothetical protein
MISLARAGGIAAHQTVNRYDPKGGLGWLIGPRKIGYRTLPAEGRERIEE